MLNYIFPIMFILFAIFSFSLSRSKKNYQKLAESYGEKFATQIKKFLKIGGYLLLICSGIWMGIIFFEY
jgi:hypothetical protein